MQINLFASFFMELEDSEKRFCSLSVFVPYGLEDSITVNIV
jgi:hypothetical protein